jgi:hypothetical protein
MSFHRHSPGLLTALALGVFGLFGTSSAGLAAMQSMYRGSPMPSAEPIGRHRGKGGKRAHRKCGAAAIKRAARKVRNVRARASKRGAK